MQMDGAKFNGKIAKFSTAPLRGSSVLASAIYQDQYVARQRTMIHLVHTGHSLYWQQRLWLEDLLNLETDEFGELESDFYESFVSLSFNN